LTSRSDSSGFAEVYDEHVWRVYGFLAYRVESQADAEDLTQQTFERALRAWARFDPGRASVGTWLISIARNLLIDHYRRDRSATERPLGSGGAGEGDLPDVQMDPDVGLEPPLADALGELSERDREIIALRFGGELTGPEIAELLGLTVANVQQVLSRSLRKLRSLLGEEPQAAKGPNPASPTAPTPRSKRPDPT
jgi:RNA polymerase sigma factor (sigma-70 family)